MRRTLEYPHSSRVVVDSAGGLEGGGDDGGRGDEVVGEGVVQVALQLEDVLDGVEFLLVSVARSPLALCPSPMSFFSSVRCSHSLPSHP